MEHEQGSNPVTPGQRIFGCMVLAGQQRQYSASHAVDLRCLSGFHLPNNRDDAALAHGDVQRAGLPLPSLLCSRKN